MANRKFQKEFRARTIGFIAAAMGLVVGLAWNEAVASLIAVIFPIQKNTIIAKFGYAVLLTIVVGAAITSLIKLGEDEEEKK